MAKARSDLTDQLRAAIAAAGVSRYVISKETGIAQSTLSRFMSGKAGMSLGALDRLGRYLELRVAGPGKQTSRR